MRNIIITGGELFNKGAQAMTFITVDQLRTRFPNHEIYLLSTEDLKRTREERERYAFKFLGWFPQKFAKAQSNPVLRLACYLRNRNELIECESIYKNCDLIVDISGYALGSNWSIANCSNYLDHIEYAKQFHIPMYLLPQSFGPFEFIGSEGRKVIKRCKKLLRYPREICVREQEGYESLISNFQLKNVCRKADLVLCNTGIDVNNIYTSNEVRTLPVIEKGSVGIVPNGMTLTILSEDELLEIYRVLVSKIRDVDKTVYLIYHANSDRKLVYEIKKMFISDDDVVLLDQDFSCIEFSEVIRKLDYIVASRFHSIVHAYKNGVPCIVLGWATKYNELLSQFRQNQYMFDIRDGVDADSLKEAIMKMENDFLFESEVIMEHLAEIQRENIFDIIETTR